VIHQRGNHATFRGKGGVSPRFVVCGGHRERFSKADGEKRGLRKGDRCFNRSLGGKRGEMGGGSRGLPGPRSRGQWRKKSRTKVVGGIRRGVERKKGIFSQGVVG